MEAVVKTFEAIGGATDNFKDLKDCQPVAIADTFIDLTREKSEEEARAVLEALVSTLDSSKRGLLTVAGKAGKLSVSPARRDVARRYFLLDVASGLGSPPATPGEKLTGCLLVPGYGPFHGIKLDQLVAEALRLAPALKPDLDQSRIMLGDIRWLCEQGLAMSS